MEFTTANIVGIDRAGRLSSEAERLECLNGSGALGQADDPEYIRLVDTIAAYFHVPIAYFSVIDADDQFLLARHGIDIAVTTRADSFCQHTILQRGVFEVEDAMLSPDFASNPYVTGSPHIRFYAGSPVIISDRNAIGSLCLIDQVPRKLKPEESRMLRHFAVILASMVENEMLRPRNTLFDVDPPRNKS